MARQVDIGAPDGGHWGRLRVETMYSSPTVVLTSVAVGLSGTLAVTGFNAVLLALTGAVLLVVGLLLVRISMQRSARS